MLKSIIGTVLLWEAEIAKYQPGIETFRKMALHFSPCS